MAKKEPLYPHVPKKTAQFPHTTAKAKVVGIASGEVYIAREDTGYIEEDHPALPKAIPYPVLYKEVKAVIDDVGWVTYLYFPSVGVGSVEVINVAPSYQRRGFGTKLLQFAIDDMKRNGITKVSASAWSKAGEKLLKAFGFSYTGKGTFMVKE